MAVARTLPMRVGDIEVQIEVVPLAGSEDTSKATRAAEGVLSAFDRVRETIVGVAVSLQDVISQAEGAARSPDQFEVVFGLKVSAEGGIIVAGVAGEASLQVKLVYESKTAPGP